MLRPLLRSRAPAARQSPAPSLKEHEKRPPGHTHASTGSPCVHTATRRSCATVDRALTRSALARFSLRRRHHWPSARPSSCPCPSCTRVGASRRAPCSKTRFRAASCPSSTPSAASRCRFGTRRVRAAWPDAGVLGVLVELGRERCVLQQQQQRLGWHQRTARRAVRPQQQPQLVLLLRSCRKTRSARGDPFAAQPRWPACNTTLLKTIT